MTQRRNPDQPALRTAMIDRSLNYGRDVVRRFLQHTQGFHIVLDIGAGSGHDLMSAREVEPSASLFAVEVHEPNIHDLERLGITVYPVDIERAPLPFHNESVDIVVMNQILEHAKEIFWVFHEVTRVLRIHGSVILGVPNLASLHNRLLLLFGRQPTSLKNRSAHVRGFTKADIVEFTQACFPGGYALRAFAGSNFYPFPPVLARPLARRFPGMAWGIFLMLEKTQAYNNGFIELPVREALETNFYLGPASRQVHS